MKQTLLILMFSIVLGSLVVSNFAFAQSNNSSPFQLVPCGTSSQNTPPPPPTNTPTSNKPANHCDIRQLEALVINIVNFLLFFSGFVCLLFILWGGLQMLIAGGQPDRISAGRTTLTNAILGFVIVLASFIIINTIVNVVTGGDITDFDSLSDFLP